MTRAAAGGGRTDLNLDASDLRLNLSPDVLELATSLAASVAQPLMQAGYLLSTSVCLYIYICVYL